MVIGEWARRVWYFLNRRRLERELEREMAFHRAQLTDSRTFGSCLRLREQSADVWGWTWMDDLLHDIRFGLRQLRLTPGFAAVAILTLTLGIGSNVAIASIINGDFFVYPPLRDPGSLRTLEWSPPGARSTTRRRQVPYDAFQALTKARSVASAACATDVALARVDIDSTTWRGPVQYVTGDYFPTLGIDMARGRALTAADGGRDAAPVAVISDRVWRSRMQAAPDILGRSVVVDGAPAAIVGVTPPGFYGSSRWRRVDVTLVLPPPTRALESTGDESTCQPIFRLRPGVSDDQARAEAALLMQRFIGDQAGTTGSRQTGPLTLRLNRFGRGIDDVEPGQLSNEAAAIAAGSFLVAALLVIPCANIAGILLARAVTRQREIATRLALGAGRMRIVRQLLTEGFLLSSIAAVLAVVVCQILWRVLDAGGPGPVVADATVLLYAAGVCVATTLGFALAPALRATRVDLTAMRDGSSGSFGRQRLTAGKVLTGVQVTLASVLLIGAAVQVRALTTLMMPRGVEPERVTLIDVDLGRPRDAAAAIRGTLAQLGGLTGVETAAAVAHAGLTTSICNDALAERQDVTVNMVSPGFLRATRIPLLAGRDLEWNGQKQVVVNESLARRSFGEANPVGRTIRFGRCEEHVIVGIAADSNNAVGSDFRAGNGIDPTAYVPLASGLFDLPIRSATLFVRALAAPLAGETLARAAGEAVGGAHVDTVQTQAQLLDGNRRGLRTAASLLAGVSLLAVFQAAFGLYAVLTHFVSRRTAEIGIRSVLGATPFDLVALVVRQSLVPVGAGIGITVTLTPVAVSVLAKARLTVPLDAGDQVALLIPVVSLLLAAFAVACSPAWRAARIAPAVAVRAD